MPAITSLTIAAARPAVGVVIALGGAASRVLKRIARAIRNRRDANQLVRLDDRMLADIGLTRSDLRDAFAGSLWRDPTRLLARRHAERRCNRRRTTFEHAAANGGVPLGSSQRWRTT